MHTRKLKLLVLLLLGVVLAACASREPLQLPLPLMADDSNSGWRNY